MKTQEINKPGNSNPTPISAPFAERIGIKSPALIDNEFPETARLAVYHVLEDLVSRKKIESFNPLLIELRRSCRAPVAEVKKKQAHEDFWKLLQACSWHSVYTFCERIYENLKPNPISKPYIRHALYPDTAHEHFASNINTILAEENIAFEFTDGLFHRRGKLSTQKAMLTGMSVMRRYSLKEAQFHYKKATAFFCDAPRGDYPNTVKEAIAAVEAAAKELFPDEWNGNFQKFIDAVGGTKAFEIPPAIAKALAGFYGFRNSGQGVSHGGANGGETSVELAEFMLAISSAIITYFAGLKGMRDSKPTETADF